ncbi:VOC family protein [Mucilaginibacter sp. BJC16-A38]|uniref:VOC family protein n=1 Tax=Mucilaginibacter phenanthrenivorans TaxID=1234842 RepID=UPI002158089A|nr:VOC family protein [Mucilaginibacter phenanthrenivorans]MCR8561677.1 VOC family protein [Mucilaginibacter phenanthrenivorans]
MSISLKSSLSKTIRLAVLTIICSIALPLLVKAQDANNANQPVFNHFALCAKDLKKTANFYRTVIQLKEIHHPFNDTVHVWLKIGEGLALHIIKGDCPQAVHNIGVHLCFSVPNLDAFIHHLDDMKIVYGNWGGEQKKIQLRADGVRQIYLQDPDGFWLEVNDAK